MYALFIFIHSLTMRFLLSLLLCCSIAGAAAQTQWYNPMNDSLPFIGGRAWNKETGTRYHRLPMRAKEMVRPPVWNLACQTAGMYVRFYTNATTIEVKYKTTGNLSMPHMPATGVSGVDLYMTDSNGRRAWCKAKYNFADGISYVYSNLTYRNNHARGNEFCLYLPLYNGVKELRIGVPAKSQFSFIPPTRERPIVIYGSSVAQGACASRPGMAWTNIVQRMLDAPVVNLGFSGNGQLDESIFRMLSELDARLFVIDCMQNMKLERVSLIQERITRGVEMLRRVSQAPILLVEHDGYMGRDASDAERQKYEATGKELRAAYERLRLRVSGLYYMTTEEIGLCMDAQVDGIHPNDLGMQQYADAYVKKIRSILYGTDHGTQAYVPCRQRREPDTYEWNARHEAILDYVRKHQPEIVMMGNSITHYWGGEPYEKRRAGQRVWNELFRGTKVVNMGYGWDRIENLLWRIEHGELDGFEARKISVLIGTNNLYTDSDDCIVRGIRQVVAAIRMQQPKAVVNVCAILPRKGMESRIAGINGMLRQWVESDTSLCWTDATPLLTDKGGRIRSEFFSDGLHPNEKGYEQIATALRRFLSR